MRHELFYYLRVETLEIEVIVLDLVEICVKHKSCTSCQQRLVQNMSFAS
jgi:hypothetical protein